LKITDFYEGYPGVTVDAAYFIAEYADFIFCSNASGPCFNYPALHGILEIGYPEYLRY
jgi:hypothetical protein